ncbi:hypothetical protein DBR42_29985 [Pelomonas sp. HMWF004]|nr:hypothetical protein DBR42_29985 [Pelomonas sp. HMWF004]
MRFNHLDLAVRDVAAAASFFQAHFAFTSVSARADFAVLTDGQGFALVLSALSPDEPGAYPRGFHVGFNVPTRQEVHDCHERMAAAAVPIVRGLSLRAGALTFECIAPGGVVVEVAHRAASHDHPPGC